MIIGINEDARTGPDPNCEICKGKGLVPVEEGKAYTICVSMKRIQE